MIQGPSFCSFEIFTELSIFPRIEDKFLLTWEPAQLAEEEIWSHEREKQVILFCDREWEDDREEGKGSSGCDGGSRS